jgi:hypothetical protein
VTASDWKCSLMILRFLTLAPIHTKLNLTVASSLLLKLLSEACPSLGVNQAVKSENDAESENRSQAGDGSIFAKRR